MGEEGVEVGQVEVIVVVIERVGLDAEVAGIHVGSTQTAMCTLIVSKIKFELKFESKVIPANNTNMNINHEIEN